MAQLFRDTLLPSYACNRRERQRFFLLDLCPMQASLRKAFSNWTLLSHGTPLELNELQLTQQEVISLAGEGELGIAALNQPLPPTLSNRC